MMNRVEKRESGSGKGLAGIKKEGTKLLVVRAKDILYRMSQHARQKFGSKDKLELSELKREIDGLLGDSDSPILDKRGDKPVWTAIMSRPEDPCEMGDMYTLREALLDCKKYLDSRLSG